MASNQPRKTAGGHNLSPLSRPSGISKTRASPFMSGNAPRPYLTERIVQTMPHIPQSQDHAIVRERHMSSWRLAPATQNSHPQAFQAHSTSGQIPPTATSNDIAANAPSPIYIPKVLHPPHPDSKLCQEFHWVPYPLGLMPYESWHSLHHRPSSSSKYHFRCPVCYQERTATAHAREVFLVAERLTWNDAIVSSHNRELNEELSWAVNHEIGILEPCVEDGRQIPGGEKSQENRFYPYQNEHEMKLALKLVFMTDAMTPATWAMWIEAQMSFQELLEGKDPVQSETAADPRGEKSEEDDNMVSVQDRPSDMVETIDLTESPEPEPTYQLSVASSSVMQANHSLAQPNLLRDANQIFHGTAKSFAPTEPSKRIQSYKTLHDFYSLLGRIERTSYVGALFLEAYAEKLRDDMCSSCWFRHNIQLDLF